MPVKKGLISVICVCTLATCVLPLNVQAETLQDYIDKLNKYTK